MHVRVARCTVCVCLLLHQSARFAKHTIECQAPETRAGRYRIEDIEGANVSAVHYALSATRAVHRAAAALSLLFQNPTAKTLLKTGGASASRVCPSVCTVCCTCIVQGNKSVSLSNGQRPAASRGFPINGVVALLCARNAQNARTVQPRQPTWCSLAAQLTGRCKPSEQARVKMLRSSVQHRPARHCTHCRDMAAWCCSHAAAAFAYHSPQRLSPLAVNHKHIIAHLPSAAPLSLCPVVSTTGAGGQHWAAARSSTHPFAWMGKH